MTVRRGVPLLVCLLATFAVAMAQPKKGAPAPKAPPAPAKDPAPAPATGSGSADAPPAPVEEPPADMEGKDENPGAPKGATIDEEIVAKPVEVKPKRTGYPTEEALRPITLPKNMAEVAIGPRAALDLDNEVGYAGSDTLRARYGITNQVQIGVNYVLGGIYDDPKTTEDKIKFKPGKAIELAVTYKIREFIGVKLGVPVWIYKPAETSDSSAPAVGLNIGVPLKFVFGEKFAIGGLDDLLSIKITQFAPSMELEYLNAYRAAAKDVNTSTSAGFIRFGAYGVYQRSPQFALIGRFGIQLEDFATTKTDGGGGVVTQLRFGIEYTVKRYLDLGISVGFDDLDDLGSFGPQGLLAFRI
jgi:hypothetical protein